MMQRNEMESERHLHRSARVSSGRVAARCWLTAATRQPDVIVPLGLRVRRRAECLTRAGSS